MIKYYFFGFSLRFFDAVHSFHKVSRKLFMEHSGVKPIQSDQYLIGNEK